MNAIFRERRVFFMVAATFSNIYLTQPILPVLREEFGIGAAQASLTVSAVVFGIALATLPFGRLADRFPARPIILTGRGYFTAPIVKPATNRSRKKV